MTAGAKANIGTTGGGSGGAPTGPAGGDLAGTYPNPNLAAAGTAGTYGSSTSIPIITTDSKGRVVSVGSASPTATASGTAGGDLSGTYPNPTVAQIQGVAVDASAPSSNDFFTYTGAQWSHARIYTGLAAVTSNTTATNGNVYPCDTTAGSFTVTLPASPATGAHIVVGLRAGTNALTISANTGQTLNGSLASVQLTAAGQSLEFWYSGTGTTWNITSGISVPPTTSGFAASGDLTGTYPNPSLAPAGTAGTYGSSTTIPVFTTDSKGRVTSVTNTALTASGTAGGDLTGTYPNPSLAAAGTAGTYGSSTLIPVFTTDSKGRVTSVTNTAAAAVANNGFTNYTTTSVSLVSSTPNLIIGVGISGFTKYLVTFTTSASATGTGTANAGIYFGVVFGSLTLVSGGGYQISGQLITTANTRGTYSYNTVITVNSTAADTLSIYGYLGGASNTLSVAANQLSIMGIA